MYTFVEKTLFIASILVNLTFSPLIYSDVSVPLPSSGTLSTAAGSIIGVGRWSSSGTGYQISWSVTQTGSNFQYVYNVTGAGGQNLDPRSELFILQVNPDITAANLGTTIFSNTPAIVAGPTTFTSNNFENLPGSIYGIEFNTQAAATFSIGFTSTAAPVWGSFYGDNGKTGNGSQGYAYNSGFGTSPSQSTSVFSSWIPTPGAISAPEPSTFILLGSFLAASTYAKRKKDQRVVIKIHK